MMEPRQDSESPKSKFEWWEILIGLLILCYVSLNIAVYRAEIARDELKKGDMVEVRFEGYTVPLWKPIRLASPQLITKTWLWLIP